jgi:hypothetical protein
VKEIHRMRNPKAKVYPLPQGMPAGCGSVGGWRRAQQRRPASGIGDLQRRRDLEDAVPFWLAVTGANHDRGVLLVACYITRRLLRSRSLRDER